MIEVKGWLVSQGCHKKYSKWSDLKKRFIEWILEVRIPKSSSYLGNAGSETCREGSFLCLLQILYLQLFLILCHYNPNLCLCLHMAISFCVYVFTWHSNSLCILIYLFYKDTCYIGLGPTLIALTWLCLQRSYFQIKSHSQIWSLKLKLISLGNQFNP